MFLKKHISFLLIALMLVSLLAGCKKTDGNSSSSVISNGHETVNSSNSTYTSSVDSEVSEPNASSGENSENNSSSKPGSGNNSSSTSGASKPVSSSKPTSSSNTQSSSTSSNSEFTSTPAGPTASNSNTATHLHTYKKITVDPTCTEDGKTFFECVECGAIKDEVVIKSTGHSWGEWNTTVEATFLSEGTRESECSVCHEKETEQIPMLEPDYSALRTELLNLVNNERTNELKYNTEKQTEADKRAEELTDNFDSKNGEGYTENIYEGSLSENGEFTAKEAFDYWLGSENADDKNNILSNEFTSTAIGVVLKGEQYYWVQIFYKE